MKGIFAGSAMHIEYHTVNPKKKKASDCIYLDTDRICQNEKSFYFRSKCFAASYCHLRLKAKDAIEIELKKLQDNKEQKEEEKKERIKKIKCTLTPNCTIYSERFGKGKFVMYEEKNMIISVQFGDKIIRFKYPDAIFEKYIIVPKYAFKQVLYDVSKAEKG